MDSVAARMISSQWGPLLLLKCRVSCRRSILSLVRQYWAWYHQVHHSPILQPSCLAQERNDTEIQLFPSKSDTPISILFLMRFAFKFDSRCNGLWCSVYEPLQKLPIEPCYFTFWSQAPNFHQNVMDGTECRLSLTLFIRLKIHCFTEKNLVAS